MNDPSGFKPLKFYCILNDESQPIVSKSFSEDFFVLESSADPDEMPHYAAFHLGLHCLQKYLFRSHQYRKG